MDSRYTSMTISQEVLARLKDRAKKNGRSPNREIAALLEIADNCATVPVLRNRDGKGSLAALLAEAQADGLPTPKGE